MKVRIHSIAELIDFIKSTPLDADQLKKLLSVGYNVYISGSETLEDIIQFLEKFRDSETLPLFV